MAERKPAVTAEPAPKGGGEPCRNQGNLGRARLMRPVVGAEARTAGKRPRDEKRWGAIALPKSSRGVESPPYFLSMWLVYLTSLLNPSERSKLGPLFARAEMTLA